MLIGISDMQFVISMKATPRVMNVIRSKSSRKNSRKTNLLYYGVDMTD